MKRCYECLDPLTEEEERSGFCRACAWRIKQEYDDERPKEGDE